MNVATPTLNDPYARTYYTMLNDHSFSHSLNAVCVRIYAEC